MLRNRAVEAVVMGVIGVCLAGCSTSGWRRMNVPEVIQALRAGEIRPGTKLPVAHLPKGQFGTSVWNSNGEGFGTFIASDEDRIVLIYAHTSSRTTDNTMFAACSFSDRTKEEWHFCDSEVMRRHTDAFLAHKTAVPPVEPRGK